MKAILQFDMDDPDDAQKFLLASNADKMASLLFRFSGHLLRKYKHADASDAQETELEEIRNTFWELSKECSVPDEVFE